MYTQDRHVSKTEKNVFEKYFSNIYMFSQNICKGGLQNDIKVLQCNLSK